MNRLTNKILITLLAALGAGMMFVQPTKAVVDPLVVQFEQTPLFSEANFMPGNEITRWVKVANNSGLAQIISAETINKSDPDNLASKINLTIKEGDNVIFNDTLSEFFDAGQLDLSNLADGGQTQYDFIAVFDSSSGDFYQGKGLGFDLLIGFKGTEGGVGDNGGGGDSGGNGGNGGNGGGGGGGGNGPPSIPPGLLISNEAVTEVNEDQQGGATAIISWQTNYSATSQVVYGIASGGPYSLNLYAPNFGYPNSTTEDFAKVTDHSVVVTGLTIGETYRYRVVSHASPPTIGYEQVFTAIAGGGSSVLVSVNNTIESGSIVPATGLVQGGANGGEEISGNNSQNAENGENGNSANQEQLSGELETGAETADANAMQKTGNTSNLLASIFGISGGRIGWFWLILLAIAIISAIIFILRRHKARD